MNYSQQQGLLQFLRTSGRLLLFAALPILVIHLCLPPFWGNPGLAAKLRFVEETTNQYDRVFFGSSRTFRQVSPLILDSALGSGSRSFNMGYAATYTPESEHACQHFLQTRTDLPRYIYVELNLFKQFEPRNLENCRDWYQVTPGAWRKLVRYINESNLTMGERMERISWATQALVKAMLLAGFMDQFVNRAEPEPELIFGPNGDGYVPLEYESNLNPEAMRKRRSEFLRDSAVINRNRESILNAIEHPERVVDHAVHREILEDLMAMGNAQGVKVVFVLPPSMHATKVVPIFNSLPPDRRIDLCDPRKYPDFYLPRFAFDRGHFNTEGSRMYTLALAKEVGRIEGSRIPMGEQ